MEKYIVSIIVVRYNNPDILKKKLIGIEKNITNPILTGSSHTIGEISKAYKELYKSIFFSKILKKSV